MATPVIEPRTRMPDMWIMILSIGLAMAGITVSASARTFTDAVNAHGMPMGIAKSIVHLVMGLVVMALMLIPDYRRLTRPGVAWAFLFGISSLLLVVLFLPAIGKTHRWIRVAGFSFQPSEFAKVVLILVVATVLVRNQQDLKAPQGLVRPLVLGGWIAGLVLLGRDLGIPVLMFGTTLVLCVAAGVRLRHAGAILAVGLVLAALFTWLEPYRMGRVMSFTHAIRFSPEALPDIQYQLRQSILAIGSGGPVGKGFGLSTQKAFFLPEADNDFVFSIIAEELGLIGALAVLAAFLVLAWRGLSVAENAQDELGRLIAIGATWMLCGQAMCHMGVVTGILPTKGLTLPFFSTGGSALIVSCALSGLLMNVSLRRRANG